MGEIKAMVNAQLQQLQMLMHRAMFAHFGKMHNPHKGQGRVLAILKMKPEISQKELTYLLNMSKQAVAELIGKLEKSGAITREPSEADKRVMRIKLTEEGAKAITYSDDNRFEPTKIFDCLEAEELAQFSEYLGRIIKRYEAQFPGEDFEHRRKIIEHFMASHGHGFEHEPTHGFGFHRHMRRFGQGLNEREQCPAETEPAACKDGGIENDKNNE